MSQSQGAGSPVSFVCPVARANQTFDRDRSTTYRACYRYPEGHESFTLTGREKPYRANRGSALGLRSTSTSREYVCECGYRGWSNHAQLERAALFGEPR
jgi:hypothetical protein